ncbi:MAG: aminotransferase class IV [Rhodospirillales bacterium]
MKIYLNGVLAPAQDARIDPFDRGFTLGDGLFETLRVENGVARRLEAHLKRLRRGADLLGIPVPASDDDLTHAVAATIKANGVTRGHARLTLSRGPAARGIDIPDAMRPTLIIAATPRADEDIKPVRAIIAESTRRNEFSPLASIKSLNYLDNVLARREARAAGADDALLLNSIGAVAESTVANLFVAVEGQIVTPPVRDGALPGIMRADVIAATGAFEQTLAPHAFGQVSEAFLTNSLGVYPLIEVGGKKIGGGQPGPVCKKLQALV